MIKYTTKTTYCDPMLTEKAYDYGVRNISKELKIDKAYISRVLSGKEKLTFENYSRLRGLLERVFNDVKY